MSAVPEDVMALPCPHCGGPAKRLEPMGFWRPEGYTPNGVRYTCEDIECNLPQYGEGMEERALENWNRRAALASEAASQVPADGWWKERLPRAGESWEEAAFRLHASPSYGGSLEDARCAVYDAADRDRAAPDREGPADGK